MGEGRLKILHHGVRKCLRTTELQSSEWCLGGIHLQPILLAKWSVMVPISGHHCRMRTRTTFPPRPLPGGHRSSRAARGQAVQDRPGTPVLRVPVGRPVHRAQPAIPGLEELRESKESRESRESRESKETRERRETKETKESRDRPDTPVLRVPMGLPGRLARPVPRGRLDPRAIPDTPDQQVALAPQEPRDRPAIPGHRELHRAYTESFTAAFAFQYPTTVRIIKSTHSPLEFTALGELPHLDLPATLPSPRRGYTPYAGMVYSQQLG